MNKIQPLHLVLGGAGLIILGALLPWASVSIKIAGASAMSNSASGLDGDGRFTLILGIAAVVLTVLKNPPQAKLFALIALIASGLAALIGLIDIFRITGNSDANAILQASGSSVSISPGIGIFITIIGGVAAAFGSWKRWQTLPAPSPSAQPPPQPPAPPQA